MNLTVRLKGWFGQDALHWIDRSYFADWAVVTLFWATSWIISSYPVYQRDIDPKDPLIGHPHRKSQIGGFLNHTISLYLPITIVVGVGSYQRSLHNIHHGVIAVSASRGLSRLVTEFLKNRVGRLRPDFLARCKWDDALEKCTGKHGSILDGRRSFPSGHSSAAFSGMTFLSVWFAGQTASWCISYHLPPSSLSSSRLGRIALTIIPLLWATYVAVTRIEDYRHHKEDVIVGSLIGILSALVCYSVFWPNPFSMKSFAVEQFGRPRLMHTDVQLENRSDYELTRLNEDVHVV